MGQVRLQVWVVISALAWTSGCHRVFRGKVTQPNPLSHPTETLRKSEEITIVTGDMELEMPREAHGGVLLVNRRYPLCNIASFTVVTRDRLRFHVQIEHKWRKWADLHTWHAFMVNSKGQRFVPENLEFGEPRHVVHMWDFEKRSVRRSYGDRRGDIVAIKNDGYKRPQYLGSLSVFRGKGDFVFYSRDIFTPDVEWMTLVVERRGVAFTFTWKFADPRPFEGDIVAAR